MIIIYRCPMTIMAPEYNAIHATEANYTVYQVPLSTSPVRLPISNISVILDGSGLVARALLRADLFAPQLVVVSGDGSSRLHSLLARQLDELILP